MIEKGQALGYSDQLKVIHLKNSKYPTGSKKDRHTNIFHSVGHIKAEQFKEPITLPILKNIRFILETPDDEGITHKEEIEMLQQKWEE